MYNFRSYLQDLNQSTGINFNLVGEDGVVYYESNFDINNSDLFEFDIEISKKKAKVIMEARYEICTSLLKYSIENKYKELFSIRDQTLIDLLDGKEVRAGKLDKNFPFLSKGYTLFLVSVDGSRYEALNIMKQLYNEQDVISMIYGEYVVIVGSFGEILEHAQRIRESIISHLYCRCFISFGQTIYMQGDIKKAFEEAKECMILGRRFELKGEVYDYRRMLFEKIVNGIDFKIKKELLERFKDKFSLFDSEMINTIEEFIDCDLNISDASRKLYIHRNTLLYRLDKIHKDTGYDIREFKQATVFIIAFLVWKEER